MKNENSRIRWKGSLVLLILFTTFVVNLHVSGIHYFYTSAQTIKEDFSGSLFLWLFFLLQVMIFAFGLHFASKKILNKRFNGIWLSKFNIIIWIVLTIFFEIINFALPCSGEGCLFKLFGLYYIPLVLFGSVLIFSVIPSLILYKIYDNKKTQRTFIYIGIIISVLFFILALSKGVSCNFNSSHLCLAEKALQQNNPSICEKIDTGFYHYLFGGSSKNNCYLTLSDKYMGNENFCGNIQGDDFVFNHCISNLARNTKNAELCNQIKSTVDGWGKDQCLEIVKQ